MGKRLIPPNLDISIYFFVLKHKSSTMMVLLRVKWALVGMEWLTMYGVQNRPNSKLVAHPGPRSHWFQPKL